MKRIGLAVIAALLLVSLAPRVAEACGWWNLDDTELDRLVRYEIRAVYIDDKKSKKSKKSKRRWLMWIDRKDEESGDDTLYVWKGRKRLYSIAGGKLRKGKRKIGTIDGDQLTFGDNTYEISVTKRTATDDESGWRNKLYRWRVEVRLGETVIASGNAMAFCGARPHDHTDGEHIADIRQRVIYYLPDQAQPCSFESRVRAIG